MNAHRNQISLAAAHEKGDRCPESERIRNGNAYGSDMMWHRLFDRSPDLVMVVNDDRTVEFANRALLQALRLERNEVTGTNATSIIIDPELEGSPRRRITQKIRPARLLRQNEPPLEVMASFTSVHIDRASFTLCIARQISPVEQEHVVLRKLINRLAQSNKRLAEQVETDLLTGLLNRRGFDRILQRELNFASREKKELTCAIVDLDNFKRINDQLGHSAGDEVLRAAAHRLLSSVRKTDYVARIGGDEFLILMPDTDTHKAKLVLQRCTDALVATPILQDPHPVFITMSSGLSAISSSQNSIEAVLKTTCPALRRSKSGGKNRISESESAQDMPHRISPSGSNCISA